MSEKKLKKMMLLLLFAILLFGVEKPSCNPSVETQVQNITIMAANITSGNYSAYEAPGIRIFQGLQPDIVLIQEFNYKSGSLRSLVDKAFGTNYEYYVEPGDDNIPNGIISKYPIISAGQWNDSEVPDRDFAWAIIDIPGKIDLQAVSVHLKGSDSGARARQATALKNYIAANFDASQYIVVGGDLNIGSSNETAMNTFKTFLVPIGHIPVDQKNNPNTSEPRSKPYDWVMPNALLNNVHTTLKVGNAQFANGLVFDSSVYPSPLPGSIQYGDSHVSGMQHMAVMKAFSVEGVR